MRFLDSFSRIQLEKAPDSRAAFRWSTTEICMLLACILVGLAMRWQSSNHGLSFDETWILAGASGHAGELSQWKIGKPITDAVSPTAIETAGTAATVWKDRVVFHPPLHIWSLWWWRCIFGGSDWTASIYSGLWSLVSIGFVFAALRLQAGVWPATCTALLMAVAPVQVQLGTEVRSYSMVLALVACAFWQIVQLERRPATPFRIWLLALTLAPIPMVHYFGAIPCAVIGAWGLLHFRGVYLRHWIGALLVSASLAILVTLQSAFQDFGYSQTFNLYVPTEFSLLNEAIAVGTVPMKLLFFISHSHRFWWGLFLSGYIVLMLLGTLRSQAVRLWMLLLIAPIAAILVLDLMRGTQQVAIVRYSAAAAISAAIVPILSAFLIHRWFGWGVSVFLIGLSMMQLGSPREIGSPSFHAMSNSLVPIILKEPHSIPIVCSANKGFPIFYAKGMLVELVRTPGVLPRTLLILDGAPEESLKDLLELHDGDRFWMVKPGLARSEKDLLSWLHEIDPRIQLIRSSHRVPSGNLGLQSEPAIEMMLLELSDDNQKSS